MAVTDTTRTLNAREAVLRQLALAHDRHSADEQELVFLGQFDLADEAHILAVLTLRAFRAEMDDPKVEVNP